MVNRIWQYHFGRGLVDTPNDFGRMGAAPTHPALLDYLAVSFRDGGQSIKALHRLIVTSSTYRQSCADTPALYERDPENRLLSHGPRYRLPSWMLRDQALAAAGLLSEKRGGPSVKPYQPPGLWQELFCGKGYEADHGEGLYRRSLYTYWRRVVAPPSMIVFDSPQRESCVVRENRTDTPLQALNLMNDTIYVEASRKLGERLMRDGLAKGVRLVLDRAPKPAETTTLEAAFAKFRERYRAQPEEAARLLTQGESSRDTSLDPVDLAAWSGVASLLLTMDEAVTRQ